MARLPVSALKLNRLMGDLEGLRDILLDQPGLYEALRGRAGKGGGAEAPPG